MSEEKLEELLWNNFGYQANMTFTDVFITPFIVPTMNRVVKEEDSIWNQSVENMGKSLGFMAGMSAGVATSLAATNYFVFEEMTRNNYSNALIALSVPVITNIASGIYECVRTAKEYGRKKNGWR